MQRLWHTSCPIVWACLIQVGEAIMVFSIDDDLQTHSVSWFRMRLIKGKALQRQTPGNGSTFPPGTSLVRCYIIPSLKAGVSSSVLHC